MIRAYISNQSDGNAHLVVRLTRLNIPLATYVRELQWFTGFRIKWWISLAGISKSDNVLFRVSTFYDRCMGSRQSTKLVWTKTVDPSSFCLLTSRVSRASSQSGLPGPNIILFYCQFHKTISWRYNDGRAKPFAIERAVSLSLTLFSYYISMLLNSQVPTPQTIRVSTANPSFATDLWLPASHLPCARTWVDAIVVPRTTK